MKVYSEELDKLQAIITDQTNDTYNVTEGLANENAHLRLQISDIVNLHGHNQQLAMH